MLLFYSAAQALCIDFIWREGSRNNNIFGLTPSSGTPVYHMSMFISPHRSDKAEVVETIQQGEKVGGGGLLTHTVMSDAFWNNGHVKELWFRLSEILYTWVPVTSNN